MKNKLSSAQCTVKPLTLLFLLTLAAAVSGCSAVHRRYGETCNSRAYVQNIIGDHLSSRFHANAPVRMAIVPFSVPANISSTDLEHVGLSNQLAWKVHQEFLPTGQIPVVEVLPREDWPGKKEEFFTGNFGAIVQARAAGYDLVLVGYVEPIRSLDAITAYSKIIEVESGITLWYGQTTVYTWRPEIRKVGEWLWINKRRPDLIYFNPMVDELASCIVSAVLEEKVVPG